MGIGTGIFLIVAGAVLFWAIDVDLPYIQDDSLGLILVLAGIAVFAIAMLMKVDRPEAGIGTGIGLLAVGAVLIWAINVDLPYIDDDALGGILMGAGVLTIGAAGVINLQRRRRRAGPSGYARQPYAPDPYAQDPYAQDPYARDPYGQSPYQDPYGRDPYARGAYPHAGDPYAQEPYSQDPYRRPPSQGSYGAYGQDPYAQAPSPGPDAYPPRGRRYPRHG